MKAQITLSEEQIKEACLACLRAEGWQSSGPGAITVKRGYTDQREQTTTPDRVEFTASVTTGGKQS